jgi:hypothetical protein
VKSWKMTYQDRPNPGLQQAESQKSIWWNPQPKANFQGRMIPAYCKPELIGIFTFTFRRRKNASKSLWLDKATPEFLKPM